MQLAAAPEVMRRGERERNGKVMPAFAASARVGGRAELWLDQKERLAHYSLEVSRVL